jgi:hypothetical protein
MDRRNGRGGPRSRATPSPARAGGAKAAATKWKIGLAAAAAVAAAGIGVLVLSFTHNGSSAAAGCREIGRNGLVHAVVCPAGLRADDLAVAGREACDEPVGTPCMTYIWNEGPQAPRSLPMSDAQAAAVFVVWSNWDGQLRNCQAGRC